MPTTPIHPPDGSRSSSGTNTGLPQLLQTPSGLAILEIQGDINTPAAAPQTQSAAHPVGKLIFPHYDPTKAGDDTSWHKRVYLYVGKHQRLTGEVKKLAKPLAMVRRKADSIADGEELEIAEVVCYKLLFAHRPEPVGGGSE